MSKRDYYEVLAVAKTATDAELKSAYRKLAMKHHPDRNPGDKAAEEHFKEAAEAYAVLADPQKRSLYDRFGHQGVNSGGGGGAGFDPSVFNDLGGDFADILGNMFGFGDASSGRRRGGPQRGADLRYDLEIPFEEAARGTETTIQIPRQENCETCSGSGARNRLSQMAAAPPAGSTTTLKARDWRRCGWRPIRDESRLTLHQPVLRTAAALAGGPAGAQHVGRLAVDAIGGVDPEFLTHPLVHPGRTEVTVEIRHLGGDILPDDQVSGNCIPGGIARLEDRVDLAHRQDAVWRER